MFSSHNSKTGLLQHEHTTIVGCYIREISMPFQKENFFFFSGVGTMPPPQTPARDWGGDTPPHTSACIVHPTLLDLVTPLCDSIVNMCWGILQFVYVQIISGSSINRLMKFAPYFAELE